LIKRKHEKDLRNSTVENIEDLDGKISGIAKKLQSNVGTITGKVNKYVKRAKELALMQGQKTPLPQDQKFINKTTSFLSRMSKSLNQKVGLPTK